MADGGYTGWQLGSGFVTVGPHSEVTGKNTQPGRLIWNIETPNVRGEFDRMKAAGAIVVAEPYSFEGMPDSLIANWRPDSTASSEAFEPGGRAPACPAGDPACGLGRMAISTGGNALYGRRIGMTAACIARCDQGRRGFRLPSRAPELRGHGRQARQADGCRQLGPYWISSFEPTSDARHGDPGGRLGRHRWSGA
jgi:hypothetical protein